ncbi:MAG: hypothetical protein AAFX06_19955 [Planctomycetota bacterium]
MTNDDFIALVHQMRTAQKEYFRTRDGSVLSRSKELERRVDQAVAELQDRQPSLFDEDQQ